MKHIAGLSLALAASIAPASASSFTVLPAVPQGPTPSIVLLGAPAAPVVEARAIRGDASADETDRTPSVVFLISPSMIAYGADAIPRAREQVASIEEPAAPRSFDAEAFPMVICGGIVGNAFPTPAVAVPETETAIEPEEGTSPPGAVSEQPAS